MLVEYLLFYFILTGKLLLQNILLKLNIHARKIIDVCGIPFIPEILNH